MDATGLRPTLLNGDAHAREGATGITISLPVLIDGDAAAGDDEPPSTRAAAGQSARPAAPRPVTDTSDLIVSERSRAFRARFFPGVGDAQWNDWKWQLRSRLRDTASLERVFTLTDSERDALQRLGGHLPVGITPYYASLCSPTDPDEPLRKTMIPVADEFSLGVGESKDPLNEDGDSHVEGVVHRYPDRVLFLVTNFCAVYCRYCTRARMVGQTGEYHFNQAQYQRGLDYIAAHPEIRDVLISGGDPLTMSDDKLEWIIAGLRAIPHVEFIRVGTKVPAVLPQRITPQFTAMLRKYHPLWMSIHFMHPAEMTPEVKQACERLADAGVPLGSQTVLTAGVNDNVDTMKALMHKLLMARVRPYYIYQCDPIAGSAHLRTPVSKGLEIIEGLRGHTTGYAVPQFVIDAPGGGGKLPLLPDYVLGRDGDHLILRNYTGKEYRYYDPLPEPAMFRRG
ncbi:MAG: KamA family radical SAM protein [Planctomycetota bacterium]|nr:KamA family radical SAM protein [Planctomycetota bacterium]